MVIQEKTMNKSLVPRKPMLPPEWEKFFTPALVGAEKLEDYKMLFDATAIALRPVDIIEWQLVKEHVDISWELGQERRVKPEIVPLMQKRAQIAAGKPTLTRADIERFKQEKESPSMFTKRNPEPKAADEPDKSWLPEAYILGHREIDAIDTRIASYVYRRDAVLRQLDRYRGSMAGQMPIIDGECSELEG